MEARRAVGRELERHLPGALEARRLGRLARIEGAHHRLLEAPSIRPEPEGALGLDLAQQATLLVALEHVDVRHALALRVGLARAVDDAAGLVPDQTGARSRARRRCGRPAQDEDEGP
jgi:hypothetical protein